VPDTGSISVDGIATEKLTPEACVGKGIARAFQVPKPFGSLTVREHLVLAAVAGAGLARKEANVSADAILEQTGLTALQDTVGNSLRLLDRKRLELAKALMLVS